MRGIHDGLIGWAKLPRFTPSHAGNTSSATYIKRSGWVHPRSRGEYKSDAHNLSGLRGSSPLTRRIQYYNAHTPLGQRFIPAHAGNKKKQATITCQNRFIPAHAGNTSLTQALELSTWVHPRSRGEYARKQSDCVRSAGSSPLTRGIPFISCGEVSSMRFTPAHAGNTNRGKL